MFAVAWDSVLIPFLVQGPLTQINNIKGRRNKKEDIV